MPDQYDPKVSPRPSGDRRPADPRRGPAATEDDPLAELAKIVQGRPTASSASASRNPPSRSSAGSDGIADLEAELLNDLQASFAAVRESLPPVPPPSQPPPAPVQVQPPAPPPPHEAQPAARLPRIEDAPMFAPLPEQRSAPPPLPIRNESRESLRDEFRPEPLDETRLVPIPAPPVIEPQIQASPERVPERPLAQRPTERPVERTAEPVFEDTAELPLERAPKPAPRQSLGGEAKADLGGFQMRGSSAPTPPVRQPHSRWEKPEPPRPQPAGAASRFAPPRAAAPPIADEEEVDPFAEGGLFADRAEPAEAEDEFPLDGLGLAPGYGDDEQLPPFEDDLETLVRRRRRPSRNLVVVLAVVLVAIAGGVGFAMFNSNGTLGGTPPVITADGSPTKITPPDTTAGDAATQNKLIYDRVNSDQANSDTTLVTPGDGPIKDVASNDAKANPISRVIIPGGPGVDQPGTGDALDQSTDTDAPATAAPADGNVAVASNDADPNAIQAIGPRKVRTVVVKPDGTIVSSNATDAPNTAASAPAATAAANTAAPPATTDAPATAVADDTAAIAGNKGEGLPITAPPDNGTATATADAATTNAPVAAAPAEAPKPVKTVTTKPVTKPANVQVATADTDSAPLDLTPGTQPAAAANGGVLVQISSQRTEDAARATYRDLQAKYPNILGKYDVNLQRADVADRGTFYRVRVGPFSPADAQHLCDDLRSAGGDCVLAKR